MTTTLTRLFDNQSDAEQAVQAMEQLGIDRSDVSIVANRPADATGTDRNGNGHDDGDINDDGDVTRGVSTGALLGGAGGLLAGLGLLAIPGLGPIVAAGWLLSTAAGAGIGAVGGGVTGSIVGALKNAGHTEEDAHVYSEGVRRGGTLISARVPDDMVPQALEVVQRYHGVDAETRGTEYRSSGWSRFDETVGATTDRDTDRTMSARM